MLSYFKYNMIELKVRLGPKGQIVIPKIFRETYKMYPEQEVIIKEQEEGVLIKKQIENIVEKLRKIAERVNENKKRKSLDARTMKKTFYEQYEKRARRAGISIRK